MSIFKDRFDAAQQLVPQLMQYKNNPDAIIIAIPRGGVQLGYVLAKDLHVPLDLIFVKKIGYPGNPEYAIGAVSMQHFVINQDLEDLPLVQEYVTQQTQEIRKLLQEREARYRAGKPPLKLTDKIVIVVDDGVATGNTLMATLELIKQDRPKKIIVALPVGPRDTLERLRLQVDEVICVHVPEVFYGVGQFYQNFDQVSDEEALRLLHEANT